MLKDQISQKSDFYPILLDAIDFFTQRFHLQDLMKYSVFFSTKLLNLEKVALFVRNEKEEYEYKIGESYDTFEYSVNVTEKFLEFPLFNGRIIVQNFEDYLPENLIKIFEVEVVIPLINDTELVGFIVSNGNGSRCLSDNDLFFADILMKLMNSSIENNLRLIEAQAIRKELDRKLFDLFVINQSTKALLSELKIENLYSLATDVFSEISGSKVTTFGIYDEIDRKIKMVGYRNVNYFHNYYTEFTIRKQSYPSKLVLHIEEDQEIIKNLFVEWERFSEIDTRYIVLIVKNHILGIVTLGECRTGKDYDSSVFELIETLSSSTCIALTNAKQFETISMQKQLIESKFQTLDIFNKLSRNINSCETEEELISVSLQTVELAFGVQKAFFAKQIDENYYSIIQSVGFKLEASLFGLDEKFYEDLTDTIVHHGSEPLQSIFSDDEYSISLEASNGLIISPICYRRSGVRTEEKPVYLLIIVMSDLIKQENVLVIDTLTKNMKPILYQMSQNKDKKLQFLERAEERIDYYQKIGTGELIIYWKKEHYNPFIEHKSSVPPHILMVEESFTFNGYNFLISSREYEELSDWKGVYNPISIEDFICSFDNEQI